MNDTAKTIWWDLTDTVRMIIKDWTSDWCKDSYCTK